MFPFLANLILQALVVGLLVLAGVFVWFNRQDVAVTIPFHQEFSLPLWVVVFISAFIGGLVSLLVGEGKIISLSLLLQKERWKNRHGKKDTPEA